jgi:hypothetical protein
MHKQQILQSARQKKQLIYQKDLEEGNGLASQPAIETELFYSIEEIAVLIEELMGIDSPRDNNDRLLEVRPKGHWFEFEVAKRLGYN